jgi:hypothetical protein
MRFAETLYVRWASRRPMIPLRTSYGNIAVAGGTLALSVVPLAAAMVDVPETSSELVRVSSLVPSSSPPVPNSTLNFGAAGQDGVIIWIPDNFSFGVPITFNVVAGTLKAARACGLLTESGFANRSSSDSRRRQKAWR